MTANWNSAARIDKSTAQRVVHKELGFRGNNMKTKLVGEAEYELRYTV
jgi:hypothetical protein